MGGVWNTAMELIIIITSTWPFDLFGIIIGLIGIGGASTVLCRCVNNKCAFVGGAITVGIALGIRVIGFLLFLMVLIFGWLWWMPPWLSFMIIINILVYIAANFMFCYWCIMA